MRQTAIIIVSRERYSLLASCLESIQDNHKGNVKVYVGCDSDDPKTLEVAKKYRATVAVTKPTTNRHHALFNPISRRVDCDYIFTLNDDVTVHTKDFGTVIEATIEDFLEDKPGRIVYGRTQESWPGVPDLHPHYDAKVDMEQQMGFKFACYPIMTKETINCLGFVMPDEIPDCGADVELGSVFNTLKCSNIVPRHDRYLDIPIAIHDHTGNSEVTRSSGPDPVQQHYYAWHGGHVMKSLVNLSKHIEEARTQREMRDSDYSFLCMHLPIDTRINKRNGVSLPPGVHPQRASWRNADADLEWHNL